MIKYRFLFITTHNPFNPVGGALQRTRLLFDSLRELGHVDLVCFTGDQAPDQLQGTNYQIQYFGKGKYHVFSLKKHVLNQVKIWSPYSLFSRDPVCVDVVQSLVRKHDYTCVVSRYIEPVFLCGLYHEKNIVIDADDALEELYRSYVLSKQYSPAKRIYFLVRFLLLKHYSQQLYANAGHLFFSNASHVKLPNASHLPNIPYLKYVKTVDAAPPRDRKQLLFVGTMSYPPNYLGMDLFIRKCWKHVLEAFPDARLRIVGTGIPEASKKRWRRVVGIEIKGFVDDLSIEYGDCNLVVVPIYHGSGTNIKVLEAMQAGRSCVISAFAGLGFAGILVHRHNVMIANSHNEFTEYVIELLRDKKLNDTVRKNAADTIKAGFSVKSFRQAVKQILEKLS
jgi:glycosyltransferase involved in cell wall biosynthesis